MPTTPTARRSPRRLRDVFVLALLGLPALATAQAPADTTDGARLLRFPHVQGDRVAFVKGGDIWVAELPDLQARRLTSFDEGFEVFPRISPDGRHVAFSGEYDGTRQVYVVPFEGGTPKQLTFYPDVGVMPPRGGYDNLPYDWTPDGRFVLVRSNRTPYGQRVGRYFLVPADGVGAERALQIPEGGPATLSPDGAKLAYNIISREWRTWKRYTAGRAQDVWIYDLLGNTILQQTDFVGTDNWPMWIGERIYFTSDRTGTLNLWCKELGSGIERQVTEFTGFDVLFPSRGGDRIVFENGGDLWLCDTRDESLTKLTVTLSDDRPWTRPRWFDAEGAIGGHTISPSAKRAVVELRGELFSIPAEHGEPVNLTETPSRRERDPAWSPDGTQLAYVAEDGLDQELFVRSFKFGQETRLSDDTGAWIGGMVWSPDGSTIAVTDNGYRLWTVDVDSRERRVIDSSEHGWLRGVQWSACGTWLCYAKTADNGHGAIWVAKAKGGEPVQVTDDEWNDGSPSFDPKGRYLWFTSARDYVYGDHRFEERIYALLLRDDVESPVAPREDVEPLAGRRSTEEPKTETPDELSIDFDGLQRRLVVLPAGASRYGNLLGVDDGFLFTQGGTLKHWSLDSREVKDIVDGGAFDFTPDRKQVLYRHRGAPCLAKVSPGQKAGANALPLDGVRVSVHPPTEWEQMYTDAWRIMRDWFYDPDMHGVDWVAMRAKYMPLVAHIGHRADLDFLLGELIGELNCGHTYVNSGDSPRVERVAPAGTLGCELEVADGHWRIAEIFDGENWNESTRSPLTEPGVDVAVGDYLLAIDGEPIDADDNPWRHLVGKVGRRVALTVAERPQRHAARVVHVRPAASDVQLRYLTWVNHNRRLVDELSGGRIGYLHAPNTAVPGHRELFEGWRAQAAVKDAMILDDRYNGGGFVPVDMAQQLATRPLNYWARRNVDLGVTPEYAFEGPMTMLINGYSSSGGDCFPYYFRKLGLGKLIGERTWGGLVGYSGTPSLVDGGGLAVPNFAFVNTDGAWDVEAYGVAPDIEVFDDPTRIQAGREPVLEAAVRHLLAELEKNPPPQKPTVPKGPDRRGLVDPKSAPDPRDR